MIRIVTLLALLLAATLVQAGDAPPPGPRTETIPQPTFAEDFGVVLPGQVLTITVVAAPGYALDAGEVDKASGWTGAPYTWMYTVPASYAGAHVANFKGKYHKTGGKEGTQQLLDWSGTATAKGITVTIGDVVRGDGFPFSVPPGRTKAVAVTVDPAQLPTGHSLVLTVADGGDGSAGSATISDPANATIAGSANITVQGGAQTAPGHGGKLVIVAHLDSATGAELARSKGFSVCAHPTNFRLIGYFNRAAAPRTLHYGMWVVGQWDSDGTGDAGQLNEVLEMEKVRRTRLDAPPWQERALGVGGWIRENQSAGTGYPAGTASDEHFVPADSLANPPPAAGNVEFAQDHVFYCRRCGMKDKDAKPVPGAQFAIVHACTQNANQEYQVVTTKTGAGGPLTSLVEPGQAPRPPSHLAITHVVDQADQRWFTWTVTWQDGSTIEDGFRIEWEPVGITGGFAKVAADVTTYTTVRKLSLAQFRGVRTTFRVRASNWRGDSDWVTVDYTIPR